MAYIAYKTRPNLHYVYDMNRNSICRVTPHQFKALSELQKGNNTEDNKCILKDFQKKGFFLESPIKKIEHPATKHLKYQLERSVNSVTFQMTQNCNLRCEYCPFSDKGIYNSRLHTEKEITMSTIYQGIDFMVEHSKDVDMLYVAFYGGEPLLKKDFIIRAMEYTISQVNGKKVLFALTTNATLLDNEFAEMVKDYDLHITVSLDGPQEIHDKNRSFINGKGSFDLLYKNVKNIKSNYPKLFEKLKFNTVISPETDLSLTLEFFKNNKDICDMSKVSLTMLSNEYTREDIKYSSSFYEDWNYESLKTYLILLGRLQNENILDHKSGIERILINKELLTSHKNTASIDHPGGTCIPGLKKLFIDVHGNFFPCERADENSRIMKIGNINEGFDVDKVKKLLNVGAATEEICKHCWAFHLCTICPVSADNGKDINYSGSHKLKQCESVKENALERIKNYTMLKELGYKFRKEDLKI